jgi:hypothetical protein
MVENNPIAYFVDPTNLFVYLLPIMYLRIDEWGHYCLDGVKLDA